MTLNVVKIGNSKGIRIPKAILAQCRIDTCVDVHVERGRIVLSAPKLVRQGWAEAAQQMHAAKDDVLLLPDVLADEIDLPWA